MAVAMAGKKSRNHSLIGIEHVPVGLLRIPALSVPDTLRPEPLDQAVLRGVGPLKDPPLDLGLATDLVLA